MADYSEVISDNIGMSDQHLKCLEIIIANSLSMEDSINNVENLQRMINETENINDLARDQWMRINLVYTIFY